MKLMLRITLSCFALTAAVLGRGQPAAPTPATAPVAPVSPQAPAASSTILLPPGTLGLRSVKVTFGWRDIRNYAPNFHTLGFSLNLPVKPNLDLAASLDHGWFARRGAGVGSQFSASLTAFMKEEKAKPFVTGGLGYEWWDLGGEDEMRWSVATGVQLPVGRRLALVPRLTFSGDFDTGRRSSRQFGLETEANYWIAPATNLFLSAGYSDVNRSRLDAWNVRTGFRIAF
jgi:hypothetical protein